jgi:hypothetical protein
MEVTQNATLTGDTLVIGAHDITDGGDDCVERIEVLLLALAALVVLATLAALCCLCCPLLPFAALS